MINQILHSITTSNTIIIQINDTFLQKFQVLPFATYYAHNSVSCLTHKWASLHTIPISVLYIGSQLQG